MVEIDPESAKTRIRALKRQIESRIATIKNPERLAAAKQRIETITKLSQELNMLEGDLLAAEEAEKQEAEAAGGFHQKEAGVDATVILAVLQAGTELDLIVGHSLDPQSERPSQIAALSGPGLQ